MSLTLVRTQTPEELLADGSMSVAEAAKFSGLSRSTLYRLMEQRDELTGGPKLPYVKMGAGGRRLIPKRALLRLMASNLVIGERGLTSYDDRSAELPGNSSRAAASAQEAPHGRRGNRRRHDG